MAPIIDQLKQNFFVIDGIIHSPSIPYNDRFFMRQLEHSTRQAMRPFEAKTPLLVTLLWLATITLLVAWMSLITLLGPEKTAWPLLLPYHLRSLFLCLGNALSPTATLSQYLATSVQRFALLIPLEIAYTVVLFYPAIYTMQQYTLLTMFANLLVLALLLGIPESKAFHHHKKLQTLQPLNLGETHRQITQLANHLARLNQDIAAIADNYRPSNATSTQITTLRTALEAYLTGLRHLLKTDSPKIHTASNPDKAKKLPVVIIGVLLVIAHMSYVANKPILLIDNLTWAAFFLYTLTKSALNSTHLFRDTAQLFCSLGTGALIQLPMIVVPLLIRGANFFNDTTALVPILVITTLLYVTTPHHIAPAGLWLFERCAALRLPRLKRRSAPAPDKLPTPVSFPCKSVLHLS